MTRRKGFRHVRRRAASAAPLLLWVAAGVQADAAQASAGASARPAGPPTALSGVETVAVVQPPDWISRPTQQQMLAFLPRQVTEKGASGQVVLRCKVEPTGAVSDCAAVYESNPDAQLGEAAVKASSLFKIKPRTINGTALDDPWVFIPMNFNVKVVDQNAPPPVDPFPSFRHY